MPTKWEPVANVSKKSNSTLLDDSMVNQKVIPSYFGEVEIVDDDTDDLAIVKDIVKSKEDEDAFYIFDVGEVIRVHRRMITKIPRVEPYYAVKCNSHPTLIKMLASLNTGFDCASAGEIKLIMASGVSSDRIIFANTVKVESHIQFARNVGVRMLTVDNECELRKIKNLYPEAKIVIRFRSDAKLSMVKFGLKFGSEIGLSTQNLIRKARELGLDLHGFSFHVGSQCEEPAAYARAINIASELINYAKSECLYDVKLIDIGGGFPGGEESIDKYASAINKALKKLDPSIKVISEPGRYYASSSFTLANFVIGKKTVEDEGGQERQVYYVNDGMSGSFNFTICNSLNLCYTPTALHNKTAKKSSTIIGKTFISCDTIVRDCLLPDTDVGEWLLWPNLGAYSFSMGWSEDRVSSPNVFPFIRKSVWENNGVFFYNKNG